MIKSKKRAFQAYEIDSSTLMPTGRETRTVSCAFGAEIEASRAEYCHYGISEFCFCYVYRIKLGRLISKRKIDWKQVRKILACSIKRWFRDKKYGHEKKHS